MATKSATKEKKKVGKNSNKSKTGEMDNPSIDISAEAVLTQPDTSIANKLDRLLEVVKGMDGKLKEQEVRLQKQEERVSLNEISALPSAQSSPKVARNSAAKDPARLPSFEELKSDSKGQAEVDKRLREYQNISRGDNQGKPNTALKSGRFRSGVSKVKVPISWPQDYCSVLVGQKQPTYDELSLEQWFQGLLYCILEQDSNTIRENMLYYLTLLMQDAVELSSSTARRAHAAVLQEVEKGRVDWSRLDLIEKIKNRYTQRMVQQSKPSMVSGIQTQVCSHYNKGYCRYEGEHTVGNVLYQHYCSFCMRETHKKFDHPSVKCLRAKNQSTNTKSEGTKPKQQEQRI